MELRAQGGSGKLALGQACRVQVESAPDVASKRIIVGPGTNRFQSLAAGAFGRRGPGSEQAERVSRVVAARAMPTPGLSAPLWELSGSKKAAVKAPGHRKIHGVTAINTVFEGVNQPAGHPGSAPSIEYERSIHHRT